MKLSPLGEALAAKDDDRIGEWLAGVAAVLADQPTLDEEAIAALVNQARPRWGARSAEDAQAYLEFWERLTQRYPHPRLLGGHADVLFLIGRRTCDALRVFTQAVRRDPRVFIEYSGDLWDFRDECGPELRSRWSWR